MKDGMVVESGLKSMVAKDEMQKMIIVYEAEKNIDSVVPTRLSMDGLADDVDPDSIVLFDDVRGLIEIVMDATKDEQLSEIILYIVSFFTEVL